MKNDVLKETLEKQYRLLREHWGMEHTSENGRIFDIIKRAITDFMSQCENPAIWCYGAHTKMLMTDFIFELKRVHYIIDNGVGRTADGGFEIIRETEIAEKEIDGVLISSQKYRNDIKEKLQVLAPHIRVLDLYEELERAGIFLNAAYYMQTHPYNRYCAINKLNEEIRRKRKTEDISDELAELVKIYIEIKDFRSAIFCAEELERSDAGKWGGALVEALHQIYGLQMEAFGQLCEEHVVMLCIDGLRRKDLCGGCMGQLYEFLLEKTKFFDHAYAVSTSTYESLIPTYSENTDLRTNYFANNVIGKGGCRFVEEAKKQKRGIFFYTDGVAYVEEDAVHLTACAQTAAEKLWDFVLDALTEQSGLFYIHILYESHFSYPNPYTEEPLLASGTNIMFDYLEREGGRIRTDYRRQQRDALRYLDEMLVPLIKRLPCRLVLYADHGNILIDGDTALKEIEYTKFTFHEDLLQVPFAVKSPEVQAGINHELISIMELNHVVIGLLNQRSIACGNTGMIKAVRSEIYNPDFRYLYRKAGCGQGLLAFELFLFAEGYKLAVYSDGTTELYEMKTDRRLYEKELTAKLLQRAADQITVCGLALIGGKG